MSLNPYEIALTTLITLVGVDALPVDLSPLTLFSSQVLGQDTNSLKAEADRLFQQGIQQAQQSQYSAAIESWQKALDIFTQIGNLAEGEIRRAARKGEAASYSNLGLAYESLGDYQKALFYYKQSLAIFTEIGDRDREANSYMGLGLAYYFLGEYEKAIDYHEQSLAIATEIGDHQGEANSYANLGNAYESLGEYQKAISYYEQSLAISVKIGDRKGEARSYGNLGNAYRSLGEYEKAISYYEQSLAITTQIGDRDGEAGSYTGLGNAYTSLGEYQKAISFYKQSLAISTQIGDCKGEATSYTGLGRTYDSLGKYQKAIDYHEQSLAISVKIGDRDGEAASYIGLGNAYRSLGEYEKAISYYEQSLAISVKIGDRDREADSYGSLGLAYRSLGEYEKAISYIEQSLAISTQIGDRDGEAISYTGLGNAYYSLGEYQKAIDYHEQSLAISTQISDLNGEAISYNNLGLAYYVLKQYPQAEQNFLTAIEVFETLRLGLFDSDKVSIFETQARSYRLLQQTLIAQNKVETALEISERGRARAFVELLASKISDNPQTQVDPLTLKEIQQIAKEQKATLVEYSVINFKDGDKLLYIWVIKPSGEVTFKSVDPNTLNTTLADLVQTSRTSLGVRGRGNRDNFEIVASNPSVQQQENLQLLHQILIAPIAEFLPNNPEERVIFVPHQELFSVPFAALMDTSGQYLIEKHTILTAPAIQVLQLTRQQKSTVGTQTLGSDPSNLLIVGNPTMPKIVTQVGEEPEQLIPLPGAETEATEIAQMFKTSPLLGSNATKAEVLNRLQSARFVHLATHGLLDDFKGLGVPGAIALAPSGEDNGLLTASEILDLNINPELVVLSACDTGRGTITGDGVIGLSRSLITAGVPSLVVSLWSVPDAPTADLMVEFYEQLQQGQDKAQALRQAMLITKETHPNPRDWAAFTLIGEAD